MVDQCMKFCNTGNNLFFINNYDIIYFPFYNQNTATFLEFSLIPVSFLLKTHTFSNMNSVQQILNQNKKSKLLLKRKILGFQQCQKYSYLFKHITNPKISQIDPIQAESPRKLFIRNIFCYRGIKSIVRNDQFLCLKLKQTQNQKISFTAHLNTFLNSNSVIYQKFGQFLKIFDQKIKQKYHDYSRQNLSEVNDRFQKQLQQILSLYKNKKYVCFYYEPSSKILNFNKILISDALLTSLGYNSQQCCDDFLKYKHLFFQIFETSIFDHIITAFGQNYDKFTLKKSIADDTLAQSQGLQSKDKIPQFKFDDYVYRTIKDKDKILEQKLKASIIFSKPQINISILELQSIDEQNIISSEQKKTNLWKQELIKGEQKVMKRDLQDLKKLMHSTFISNCSNQILKCC